MKKIKFVRSRFEWSEGLPEFGCGVCNQRLPEKFYFQVYVEGIGANGTDAPFGWCCIKCRQKKRRGMMATMKRMPITFGR